MPVQLRPRIWTASGTTHAPLETQRAAIYSLAQAIGPLSDTKLSKTFDDVLMGPNAVPGRHDTNYPQSHPSGTSGRGVLASSLTTEQQALVKTAIEAWVNTVNSTTPATCSRPARARRLAKTYLAYSGSTTLGTEGSYVRTELEPASALSLS